MLKYSLSLLIMLISVSSYAGDIGTPPPTDPINHIRYSDEFFGGTYTSGSIGDTGWSTYTSLGATTVTGVAGESFHWGIKNISLNAVLNAISTLALSPGEQVITASDNFDLTYVIRPQINTDTELRVGTLNTFAAGAPPNRGLYFILDTQATSSETGAANPSIANWVCVTRSADTSTLTNSTIVVSTGTWYKLRIHKVSASIVNFYINGVLRCTNTTNIDSSTQFLAVKIENLNNIAAKNYDIDLVTLKVDGITR